MTVASGTRRGSALSTPSTSVQITISSASSRSPKIDAEKSLPFLPSVVCRPSAVRAMNPVMISVASASRGTTCAALARDSSHRTLGPSGLQSTRTMSRASVQVTRPGLRPRDSRKRANRRVDQISPNPATRSRTAGEAERVRCTACRIPTMSWQSRSRSAVNAGTAAGISVRAMSTCRSRSAVTPSATGCWRSAWVISARSASVTPRQADSTTPRRVPVSCSRMSATRCMHAASATLDPPNL